MLHLFYVPIVPRTSTGGTTTEWIRGGGVTISFPVKGLRGYSGIMREINMFLDVSRRALQQFILDHEIFFKMSKVPLSLPPPPLIQSVVVDWRWGSLNVVVTGQLSVWTHDVICPTKGSECVLVINTPVISLGISTEGSKCPFSRKVTFWKRLPVRERQAFRKGSLFETGRKCNLFETRNLFEKVTF